MSNNDRLLCPWGPRAAPPPALTPQAGKEDRTFISHFSKESKNTPHSWTFRSQSKAQGINRDSCPSPQGKRELRRQRMVFSPNAPPPVPRYSKPHPSPPAETELTYGKEGVRKTIGINSFELTRWYFSSKERKQCLLD